MWCIYFNGMQVASDIMECNESMLENGSPFTVQVSDDRSVLERTVKLFQHSPRKITADVVAQLKELYEQKKWLEMQTIIGKYVEKPPCCTPAIDRFMQGL